MTRAARAIIDTCSRAAIKTRTQNFCLSLQFPSRASPRLASFRHAPAPAAFYCQSKERDGRYRLRKQDVIRLSKLKRRTVESPGDRRLKNKQRLGGAHLLPGPPAISSARARARGGETLPPPSSYSPPCTYRARYLPTCRPDRITSPRS